MISSGAGFSQAAPRLKTIQQGTIDMNGFTTNTATITSVDVANSELFWQGQSTAGSSSAMVFLATLQLTAATTVTGIVNTAPGVALLVGYTVREWDNGFFKSMQRGTIDVNGGTTNTATISSVTTTKSVCAFTGFRSGVGAFSVNNYARLALTNATTVTMTVGANPGSATLAAYEVKESP